MLTDEEIKIIYDEYEREIDAGHTVNGFARAIERAVLKKLGEQEPVLWQGKTDFKTHMRFKTLKPSDEEMIRGEFVPLYANPLPAQAVPEGSVIASTNDLKRIHRDLDACQKVIWLAGGFDPEYCKEAQESLMLIDAMLSASPKP